MARVAQQGKLRNQQHFSAHILNGEVHFAVFVLKNAQARDFVCAIDHIVFAIAVFHAHEHQIARTNRGDFLFVHGYARVRNPLHYTTHNGLLVIGSRDRLRSRRSACATA